MYANLDGAVKAFTRPTRERVSDGGLGSYVKLTPSHWVERSKGDDTVVHTVTGIVVGFLNVGRSWIPQVIALEADLTPAL